jgi:hypothetical protein
MKTKDTTAFREHCLITESGEGAMFFSGRIMVFYGMVPGLVQYTTVPNAIMALNIIHSKANLLISLSQKLPV